MGMMQEMMKDLTVGGFTSLGEKVLGRKSNASMKENIVKGAVIRGAVNMLKDSPEDDSVTYERPRYRYHQSTEPLHVKEAEPEEDDPAVKLMYEALSGKDIWTCHVDSDKMSELTEINQFNSNNSDANSDTYDYAVSDYDSAKKLYEKYYK